MAVEMRLGSCFEVEQYAGRATVPAADTVPLGA